MAGIMQPEVTVRARWYQIETTGGTEYVPEKLVGARAGPAELQDFVQGDIESADGIEIVWGHGYRLSAPGYLDCTDWGVCETLEKALEELRAMWCECEDPMIKCDVCSYVADVERQMGREGA